MVPWKLGTAVTIAAATAALVFPATPLVKSVGGCSSSATTRCRARQVGATGRPARGLRPSLLLLVQRPLHVRRYVLDTFLTALVAPILLNPAHPSGWVHYAHAPPHSVTSAPST